MPRPRKATTSSRRKPAIGPALIGHDELASQLGALRERLVSSVTLTTERLQDTVEDAVRRGRMTRRDAEDLLASLLSAGRQQTEALLADVEQALSRGSRTRRRGRGDFPIRDYDELTAAQVLKRLDGLSAVELRRVGGRERRGAARRTVLAAVERRLR